MTVPIARVVATRYATVGAAAALLLSRARLSRRAAAARAGARVPAGGHRADRLAAPEGTAEALDACSAARSTRPGCATTGWGSATPRCTGAARRLRGGRRGARAHPARARHTRLRRPGARGRRARPRRRGGRAAPARAADARRRRGARGGRGAGGRSVAGMRAVHELLEPRGRRAGDLRPRAGARPRLLHGRGVRGLRPGARRRRSAAAGATTSCSGASGGRCPRSASRSTWSACTSR